MHVAPLIILVEHMTAAVNMQDLATRANQLAFGIQRRCHADEGGSRLMCVPVISDISVRHDTLVVGVLVIGATLVSAMPVLP